jgi:hypothetical protein
MNGGGAGKNGNKIEEEKCCMAAKSAKNCVGHRFFPLDEMSARSRSVPTKTFQA